MCGRGQRNKVMKYGEGPRRVRCPWAPNVLATPLCVYNSIIDLFRKDYEGLKLDFWQLIPLWSSGLVVWLMISGLEFYSRYNLILKK